MDNGKQMSLKEMLNLPEGWSATRFPSTVELEGPNGLKACIPAPYYPQSITWWCEQAAIKIKEAQDGRTHHSQ